jgi:hypothetical protein
MRWMMSQSQSQSQWLKKDLRRMDQRATANERCQSSRIDSDVDDSDIATTKTTKTTKMMRARRTKMRMMIKMGWFGGEDREVEPSNSMVTAWQSS